MIIERMLEDYGRAYGFNTVALRYFNAAGCDPDGEIGEQLGPEPRAIPRATAAALNDEEVFTVNGTEFDTRDGSAIRDYVHDSDLARAHVLAAEMLVRRGVTHVFNLGTGLGTTVLEVVEAVRRASGGGFGCVLCLQDAVILRFWSRPPTRRRGSSDGFRCYQLTESWKLRSRGSGRTVNVPSGFCFARHSHSGRAISN
jgi:nucleoside-diphosphate-sugar epimerase